MKVKNWASSLATCALLTCGALPFLGFTAASAQADSFTWLGPTSTLSAGGSRALPSVSCPTASQCTTVDAGGEQITYDPSTGAVLSHTAVDQTATVTGVSCVSAAQCVAVDMGGNELDFNPATGNQIASGFVSIDSSGAALTAVSCTAVTACTAVDSGGAEVSFNPSSGVGARSVIGAGTALTAVSCVAGSAQCTVIDRSGRETTFNVGSGFSPGAVMSASVDSSGGVPAAVSCPAATVCTTVDGAGYEVSFNPQAPTPVISSRAIDTTTSYGPGSTTTTIPVALHGVSCPSVSLCIAVDNLGDALTYAPQSASPTVAPYDVDGILTINSVSCPPGTTTMCGAVDNRSHGLGVNPSTGSASGPYSIVAPALTSVSCPTRTQCTTVESGLREITFDPTTGTINSAGAQLIDIGGGNLTSVSCLSATECTAVDDNGAEVTFNPTSGREIANGFLSLESVPLTSVACLLTAGVPQCTTVDTAGNEVTFDPETSTIDPNTPQRIDPIGGVVLTSLACPSGTQCTAVDSQGDEVTFNPVTGNNYTTQQAVNVDAGDLTSVACPSTSQCSAVDSAGAVVTFLNSAVAPPTTATGLTRQNLEAANTGTSLNSISCPSVSQCTAVDSDGQEATFNPSSTTLANTSPTPIAHANALSAVSCQSSSICTAVDAEGNSFAAFSPPMPVTGAPPTITGTAQQDDTLTAHTGQWTNTDSSSSYTYAWEDCASAADTTSCTPIPNAAGTTYVPADTDVGRYVRVLETATNESGSANSSSVLSAATAVVAPARATSTAPPTITKDAYYQQGATLTEHHGTWTQENPDSVSTYPGLTYAYQWEDCNGTGTACSAIPGATSSTYVPTASDVGSSIAVTEVANDGSSPSPAPVESAPTPVIAPAPAQNTAPPTIVGSAVQQGQVLTDRHGAWSNLNASTTFTYQWEECNSAGTSCAPISGATAQTYTPGIADVGNTLVVAETAQNGGLPVANPSVSAPTSMVLPTAPSPVSPPAITGLVQQGRALTAVAATWSGGVDGPDSVSYQWFSCDTSGTNCSPITGATGTTYTPAAKVVGQTILVKETATNRGGATTAVSAATAPVAAAAAPAIKPITLAVTALGPKTSTLQARLNPKGLAGSWHFEYGRSANYSSATPSRSIAAKGPDTAPVSATVSGLLPSTTYHYRIVETVAATKFTPAVTVDGADRTFTTSSIGKFVLKRNTLTVKRDRLSIPLTCASLLPCVARFTLTTTAQVGAKSAQTGAVDCVANEVVSLQANQTRVIIVPLTRSCLALLKASSQHRLAASFTTRPRTGQAGAIQTVRVIETSTGHRSAKARARRG